MKKTITLLVLSFLMLISAIAVQAAAEQEEPPQSISIAEAIRSFYIEEYPEIWKFLSERYQERIHGGTITSVNHHIEWNTFGRHLTFESLVNNLNMHIHLLEMITNTPYYAEFEFLKPYLIDMRDVAELSSDDLFIRIAQLRTYDDYLSAFSRGLVHVVMEFEVRYGWDLTNETERFRRLLMDVGTQRELHHGVLRMFDNATTHRQSTFANYGLITNQFTLQYAEDAVFYQLINDDRRWFVSPRQTHETN